MRMKILLISDIHSSFGNLKRVLADASFDIVAIAGDITNFRSEDVKHADAIIAKFGYAYAVHGNCDYEEILEYDLDAIEFVHARSVRVDDFVLHGVGGSGITPFNTPSEYGEDEMEFFFSKFRLGERNFLLSHCPPKGILDRTRFGMHAGCEVIRRHADDFELIMCGHIHESPGVFRGSFVAVNPGPVFERRYALVETEGLNVELRKVQP
ncbi:MAG: metallophosphoesterase [Archaeoglobaceae archaeon]